MILFRDHTPYTVPEYILRSSTYIRTLELLIWRWMRAVGFMHISQFGVVLVDPWVSILVYAHTYVSSTSYKVLYYIKQDFPAILSCIIICYICYIYTLTLSKARADDESSSIRTFLVCASSWPPWYPRRYISAPCTAYWARYMRFSTLGAYRFPRYP